MEPRATAALCQDVKVTYGRGGGTASSWQVPVLHVSNKKTRLPISALISFPIEAGSIQSRYVSITLGSSHCCGSKTILGSGFSFKINFGLDSNLEAFLTIYLPMTHFLSRNFKAHLCHCKNTCPVQQKTFDFCNVQEPVTVLNVSLLLNFNSFQSKWTSYTDRTDTDSNSILILTLFYCSLRLRFVSFCHIFIIILFYL